MGMTGIRFPSGAGVGVGTSRVGTTLAMVAGGFSGKVKSMDSTFSRALLGFVILSVAIASMAWIALWGIQAFGGGTWWASLLVVIMAMVSEVGVYTSTLHGPIYDWIKEPKLKADAERCAAEHARKVNRTSA